MKLSGQHIVIIILLLVIIYLMTTKNSRISFYGEADPNFAAKILAARKAAMEKKM